MSLILILHTADQAALADKVSIALNRKGHHCAPLAPGAALFDAETPAPDFTIVIWSRDSAVDEAIMLQAAEAMRAGFLIPLSIAGGGAPAVFGELTPVDLTGWRGDDNDPRWRFVLDEIDLSARRQKLQNADVWAENGEAAFQDDLRPENPAEIRAVMAPPPPELNDQLQPPRSARFDPRAVAVVGALALLLMTGAALLIAPAIFSGGDGGPIVSEDIIVADIDGNAGEGPPASDQREVNPPPFLGNLETGAPPSEPGAGDGEPVEIDAGEAAPGEGDLSRDADETSFDAPEPPQSEISDAEPAVAEVTVAAGEQEDTPVEEGAGNDADAVTDEDEPKPASIDDLLATVDEITEVAVDGPTIPEGLEGVDEDALGDLLAAIERGKAELSLTEPPANAAAIGIAPPSVSGMRDCAGCPVMVVVQASRFNLGSAPDGLSARDAEGPVTAVSIPRAYAISAHEVTFAQWNACVADGGCAGLTDSGWGRGVRPAINVAYREAVGYTRWLSQETGARYRLPSEAEWELAAQNNPGAVTATTANFNASLGSSGGPLRNQTTPVASFAPNSRGLYDVFGNVWEWTADCWSPNHRGVPTNGDARDGDCTTRVLKGGAWNTGAWRLRPAHRIGKAQSARENDIGFRVVKELD